MLTYTPFGNRAPGNPGLRGNPLEGSIGPVNVGEAERYGSIVGGAALAVAGIARRGFPGLLLAAVGGLFIMRGLGGHCRLYDAIGVATNTPSRPGVPDHTGRKIDTSILIARPPEELFRFWRNLENLPEFMENIEAVKILNDRLSHWTLRTPGGQRLEWDAEIVNEHRGEMLSWQTLPGADIQSAGTVRFIPVNHGAATRVRLVLEFHLPGGAVGAQLARFFGHDPEAQLDLDLARLKEMIEDRPAAATAG
jgi:uncharacterized membrane protein